MLDYKFKRFIFNIVITEYISGFHLAFSRRCENRVFTADIQVGDE